LSTITERSVPLLDLRAQHATIREEILTEIARVVDSQKFILGEDVQKLEQAIAAYSRTKFAVGCASGSDAVLLALMAVGVAAGDRVLTSPYTFFATGGAIARLGAIPVFVDVDPDTFNLDARQAEEALAHDGPFRAIMPVHLFGACADMDPLLDLAAKYGCATIEDAAQSIGAEYKGRRAGSMGDVGCFSFFPSKNLGAYGDGGMLSTSDEAMYDRLMALRVHGSREKYVHEWVGINSRLDTLQAAVLAVKLRYLDSWTEGRRRNAERYRQMLGGLHLAVRVPVPAAHSTRHIYNQFAILAPRRDELRAYLKTHGVGTEVYYPIPLHLQACFADLGYREGSLPVSERLARESLALPVYPELGADDIEYVCDRIRAFYKE
jgi:dTDP-4-amino-4,6-dideoxygalactose transaminase